MIGRVRARRTDQATDHTYNSVRINIQWNSRSKCSSIVWEKENEQKMLSEDRKVSEGELYHADALSSLELSLLFPLLLALG